MGIDFNEGQPIEEDLELAADMNYSGQINSLKKPHGLGVLKGKHWAYEGSFYNGKRDGYGRLYFWNGSVYEGFIEDEMFVGEGTMTICRWSRPAMS